MVSWLFSKRERGKLQGKQPFITFGRSSCAGAANYHGQASLLWHSCKQPTEKSSSREGETIMAVKALVVNSLYSEAIYCNQNVIIPKVPLLSHQREYPKANSPSYCKHHIVKLWSSLWPKPCQYKSSKMLSGILPSAEQLNMLDMPWQGKYFWNLTSHGILAFTLMPQHTCVIQLPQNEKKHAMTNYCV